MFGIFTFARKEQIGDTVYMMRIAAGCIYRYNF